MNVTIRHAIHFLCGLLLVTNTSFAQETVLEQLIQAKKTDGTVFMDYNDFVKTANTKVVNEISNNIPTSIKTYSVLSLNSAIQEEILVNRPATIKLRLPKSDGTFYDLELVQVNLFTPDFTLKEMPSGKIIENPKTGVHYQGVVVGEKRSSATMSFFEHEVMGLLLLAGGRNITFGKINDRPEYILYDDTQLEELFSTFKCGMDDLPMPQQVKEEADISKAATECIGVHFDVDKDLVNDKGGTTQAAAYVFGLFTHVTTLYANESIPVKISGLVAWTSDEPFRRLSGDPDLINSLEKYRDYRNANAWTGSISHYVHYDGGGGLAWVDALCDRLPESGGYGTAGINSSYAGYPTFSLSVFLVAHEMGHNFGSAHTHSCFWNGNNTAIDACVPTEAWDGVPGGCPATTPTPSAGTMMSYCYLASGIGIDMTLGFGTQPGNLMRSKYAAASCDFPCASCHDGIKNQDETGVDCGGICPFSCGTCNDNIQNQDETGVDCGGVCDACCDEVVECSYRVNYGTWITGDCSLDVCEGTGNVTLSVDPNSLTKTWTGPNGFTDTGWARLDNITPSMAGTYSVTATDGNGCSYTKAIELIVHSVNPICEYNAGSGWVSGDCSPATLCEGEEIRLSVLPNNLNQSWTGPNGFTATGDATLSNLTVNMSGTYTVTTTDAYGCTNTLSIDVAVEDCSGASIADGCYYMQFKHSGKYVSNSGGSGNNGNIQQNSFQNTQAQQFTILAHSSGDGYTIGAGGSKGIEVASASGANGGNIGVWNLNMSADHHRWYFEDAGGGYYNIRNKNSNLYFSEQTVSNTEGANVHQWQLLNQDNEKVRLIPCNQCPAIGTACNDSDACIGSTTYEYTAAMNANGTHCDCVGTNICTNIEVKTYLGGTFNSTSGMMNNALNLPNTDPYGLGVTAAMPVMALTGNNAIVDWVLIELRNASTANVVAAQMAALIQRDGDVVDATTGSTQLQFIGLPSGTYHIAVRHRNHLGVMSESGVVTVD